MSGDLNGTVNGMNNTHDGFHESGFTTSGLAKDGQFMTMRNGKIKVFKNEFIAAFDGEILNINGGVIWVNGLKV